MRYVKSSRKFFSYVMVATIILSTFSFLIPTVFAAPYITGLRWSHIAGS